MSQITLTESQLRNLIQESVEQALLEEGLFGNRLSNSFNQHYNSLKSGWYDNKANNMADKISQQIAKSQQIIKGEQQKINNLRAQYNAYVQKSGDALGQANKFAAANGKTGQNGDFYTDTRMQQTQDNTQQDFYNQADVDKATNSARASERGKFGNKVARGQYVNTSKLQPNAGGLQPTGTV